MIKVGTGKEVVLAARIVARFGAAVDDLDDDIRRIVAENSVQAGVVNGNTIKRSVRAAGERGDAVTTAALDDLERACRNAGVSRKGLQEVVKREIGEGFDRLATRTRGKLEALTFEPADLDRAQILMDARREAALDQCQDQFDGWAGPGFRWAYRHPLWAFIAAMAATFAVSVAADLVVDRITASPETSTPAG